MDRIDLGFDKDNMMTFIKELLNTENNNILQHVSFGHQLHIKALGNQKEVRKNVLEWLQAKVKADSIEIN